jgi:hypothetical protein
MQTFPVDIEPEQIIRWLLAEQQAVPPNFRISIRRSEEEREIPVRRELHLGDEEREDLSEVATVATLEIAPLHAGDGWLLTIVVEDEAGPRAPAAGEEEIDLKRFYREFIRPGRGSASVVAEVQDSAAEARLTRVLNIIDSNRHAPDRGRSRE